MARILRPASVLCLVSVVAATVSTAQPQFVCPDPCPLFTDTPEPPFPPLRPCPGGSALMQSVLVLKVQIDPPCPHPVCFNSRAWEADVIFPGIRIPCTPEHPANSCCVCELNRDNPRFPSAQLFVGTQTGESDDPCLDHLTLCPPANGSPSVVFQSLTCTGVSRGGSTSPCPLYFDDLLLRSTGGSISIVLDPTCTTVPTSLEGTINLPQASAWAGLSFQILRHAVVVSGAGIAPIGAIVSGNGQSLIGGISGIGPEYSVNIQGTLDSSGNLSMVTLGFVDAEFDLDLDGRFSQLDVDAATLLLGQAPPTGYPLQRVDIDGDGTVTASDVVVLQTLVDAGFASGVAGDVNGDTVFNCADDLSAITTGVLGGAGYQIVADLDLDGAVTQAEIDALPCVRALTNPENDVNGDENIDLTDAQLIAIFATSGSGVGSDVNCDENVDLSDAQFLANALLNGCL